MKEILFFEVVAFTGCSNLNSTVSVWFGEACPLASTSEFTLMESCI